jgi:hypothetical protein
MHHFQDKPSNRKTRLRTRLGTAWLGPINDKIRLLPPVGAALITGHNDQFQGKSHLELLDM